MDYSISIKLNDLVTNKLNKIKSDLNKLNEVVITPKVKIDKALSKLQDKRLNISTNIKGIERVNSILSKMRDRTLNIFANIKGIDRVNKLLNSIKGKNISINANIKTTGSLDFIKDRIINLRLKILDKDKIKKDIDNLKTYALQALSVVSTAIVPLKQSMDFELQFVDVKKVSNFSDKELADIKKMIFDIASKSSASVKDITKITAEGIATGKIPLSDMREYINLANQAKVAFGATNDQLGKALNASLAKLGYNVKETTKLFDMLNYSTNISSSKMTDMLNVLSRTAGAMSKLKTNEIATFINFGVEKGVSPETTATSLNSIMNSISELNKDLVAKLKDKKGLDIKLPFNISGAEALQNGKGFEYIISILKQIKKEANPDKRYSLITSIFGKGEQKNLIENFLNDLDGLQDRLDKISMSKNFSNSVKNEFQQVEATAIKKIEKFKGLWNILMIKIGDTMLSLASSILSVVNPIMEAIIKFAKEHKELIGIIFKVLAVLGGLLTAFLIFKGVVLALTFAFGGLLGVLSILNAPIVLIGTLIYGLIKYWEDFKNSFTYIIDTQSLDLLLSKLSFVRDVFIGLWRILTALFEFLFSKIFNFNSEIDNSTNKINIFSQLFQMIGVVVGETINIVIGLLNNVINVLTFIAQTIQTVIQAFISLGVGIVSALTNPIETIKSIFNWLNNIYSKIKNIISSVTNIKLPSVSGLADKASNAISKGYNSVKSFFGFGGSDKANTTIDNSKTWNTKQLDTSNRNNRGVVDINLTAKGVTNANIEKKRGFVNVKNINID